MGDIHVFNETYRPATDHETATRNCDECYSLLVGPNGFECLLTEPEDRIWHRDLRPVVAELNRLNETEKKLRNLIMHIHEYWNGDENERAMGDALHHIVATCEDALQGNM